ncbi:tRNA-dihydrouridine synthase [Butyrivibrio sp. ob235]|uniref:tRNA dihydrouridine synthase n=1 Tax=Butyrivibrio sp. ob235 TaxID=1761780 RepID=UPI0008D5368B|nr:tRNA-dihydrouridine synthase family protein [Butyrivibrio sp. ob235]SEM05458.1 tRNA-dihydrouridine synthase [Butyrivibrio sp. ob235]
MRTSFAPMEGITLYCYRNAHHRIFEEGIDVYYTPFLSIYKHHSIKKRDIREILPENNSEQGIRIIPQIMANDADEIIWALGELHSRGYDEINLNMGCPVGTVVSKHKGSGMLEDPERLDVLFAEVFDDKITRDIKFSVKTRLGLVNPHEFEDILPVLNKYPFSSVIIHPRVRTQMYKGLPDIGVFSWAYENSKNPVGYNGNIFHVEDYQRIIGQFPDLCEVMLGRGLVANPALARQISGGSGITLLELKDFIRELENCYKVEIPAEESIMHKMKEIWFYVGNLLIQENGQAAEPYIHKIRTAKNIAEYRNAERAVFKNCIIKET